VSSFIKTKVYSSNLYLLLGFAFLFFSNGRWILPIAAFAAPIFLIRFLRYRKPFNGFLILVIAGWISNIFIWKGMIPASGFFYYFLMLMMSIFISLTFVIDRIFSRKLKGIVSTLVLPSVYVLMEYITVSTNPSGSYGTLAHTQSSLPLLQLISLTGIWGVTFIILWTASVLNWLWDDPFDRNRFQQALVVFVVPVTAIILFGQIRLSNGIEAKTVRIASINIRKTYREKHPDGKNDSLTQEINNEFLADCDVAASSGARIVFGTEEIINLPFDRENEFVERAKVVAQKDSIYVGLPMCIFPKDFPRVPPINKITWISSQGQLLFTYVKAKPTPGEGSYGDGVIRCFDTPYGRIGSAICFDMDFPAFIYQVHTMNIDMMLVPGNDWREITPYHTYVASFRALEQGFNLVRAASRGLSAAFNYKGQLLSSQDFYRTYDAIFYTDVPMRGQRTVYSVIGDLFAWLCIGGFVIIVVSTLLRRKADLPSTND
jgi:apolipoprotein N-acyltransferase